MASLVTFDIGDWVMFDRSAATEYAVDPMIGVIMGFGPPPEGYPLPLGRNERVYKILCSDGMEYENWPAITLTHLDLPASTDREEVEAWLAR